MNPIGSQFYSFRDIDQISTAESSMTENSMTEGAKLDQWVKDAENFLEKKARREAVESIMAGGTVLSLVNVSSFPPIPESIAGKIRHLDLRRMGMDSLEKLPRMKELERLDINDCGNLNSLKGLPTTEGFKYLDINGCHSLKSLKGMPENMEYLQELVIAKNWNLQSLDGMPEKMNGLKSFKIDENNSLENLDGLPSMMNSLKNLDIRKNNELSSALLPNSILSNPKLKIAFIQNEKLGKELVEDLQNMVGDEPHSYPEFHVSTPVYDEFEALTKIQVWNSRR